jgi:5-deoxy-glucuronate isomerase
VTDYYLPAGAAAAGPYALSVTPADRAALNWCSLRVAELAPGGRLAVEAGDEEMFVLPLAGSCTVECGSDTFELAGRDSVFARVSDAAYVPRDASMTITATGPTGGRFALPAARCSRRLTPRYLPAEDVPVEIRGGGNATRQVNNFGAADVFEADRLIAVEVITPAGNWSSYPPHKHDEDRPGKESLLEEIYYFEIADGAGRTTTTDRAGFGFHRVYGAADRPIDVLAEVRTGDVVLIPHGWHGPSVAAPGYHMYYLNVMAGPGAEREWLIRDDPAHGWVRDDWERQGRDPRLPLTAPLVPHDHERLPSHVLDNRS